MQTITEHEHDDIDIPPEGLVGLASILSDDGTLSALPLGAQWAIIDITGQDDHDTTPDEAMADAMANAIMDAAPDGAVAPMQITAVDRDRTQILCMVALDIPDGKLHRDRQAREALWRSFLAARQAMGMGGRCDRRMWRRPATHAVVGRTERTQVWWSLLAITDE